MHSILRSLVQVGIDCICLNLLHVNVAHTQLLAYCILRSLLQVVIGGRNKYLINGSNATPTRVQDLFRSVQLNVNNPHFLIMQGRITKVLNMKPPEVREGMRLISTTQISEAITFLG